MKAKSFCLQLRTERAPQFIDITGWVGECVAKSKVSNGFAVVYSKHTTAAVKINENEPLLIEDMSKFLEKISPRNGGYQHNDFTIRTVNMNPDYEFLFNASLSRARAFNPDKDSAEDLIREIKKMLEDVCKYSCARFNISYNKDFEKGCEIALETTLDCNEDVDVDLHWDLSTPVALIAESNEPPPTKAKRSTWWRPKPSSAARRR